ncbi:hypothetical protein [Oscillatoria sp. HE19RPO]|uniref:hypothetical protein n=1 Tax=Oscillatoria sp. HE19RPO TaxID=2954806 RepID=UPI0020C5AC0B|nr:hypothetical protein [Oscillatoria sp. HE19RPO]
MGELGFTLGTKLLGYWVGVRTLTPAFVEFSPLALFVLTLEKVQLTTVQSRERSPGGQSVPPGDRTRELPESQESFLLFILEVHNNGKTSQS